MFSRSRVKEPSREVLHLSAPKKQWEHYCIPFFNDNGTGESSTNRDLSALFQGNGRSGCVPLDLKFKAQSVTATIWINESACGLLQDARFICDVTCCHKKVFNVWNVITTIQYYVMEIITLKKSITYIDSTKLI